MTAVAERTDTLVGRADGVHDLLRANAPKADRDRRLGDDTVAAIADAGLFKVWVPRRYGGFQADPETHLEMTAALSRGCAAAGWVTAMMTATSWMACWATEECQDEIYGADPDARLAGLFTPCRTPARPVDGGYVISGAWPFATGCLWATWAEVMAPVVEDGQVVDALWCFVPLSDLTIEDTWFCMGMRGTGSNTLHAQEIFVPEHRTVSMMSATGVLAGVSRSPYKEDVLYRIPLSMAGTVCTVGSVLGAAEAALEHVMETVPRRGISYSKYLNQAESASTQMQVAEAAMKIDSARLVAQRAARDAWQAGVEGVMPDVARRARARYDAAWAIRECKHAMDLLVSVSGASAFAEGQLLERLYRDVSTATLHGVFRPDITSELYGSILLGQAPTVSPIL